MTRKNDDDFINYAAASQERLRQTDTPVIGRVSQERLLLDVRCLTEEDLGEVAVAVRAAL